jgi:hypothetical protein
MTQALGTIERVHGSPSAGTLHGGYQQQFFKITGTDIGTVDTGGGSLNNLPNPIVEGNYTKAIRAIQTIATTVWIGPAEANGFVIAVDGATAQPTGPAYNADETPTFAERLKAVLDTNTGVTTTVALCLLPASKVTAG